MKLIIADESNPYEIPAILKGPSPNPDPKLTLITIVKNVIVANKIPARLNFIMKNRMLTQINIVTRIFYKQKNKINYN